MNQEKLHHKAKYVITLLTILLAAFAMTTRSLADEPTTLAGYSGETSSSATSSDTSSTTSSDSSDEEEVDESEIMAPTPFASVNSNNLFGSIDLEMQYNATTIPAGQKIENTPTDLSYISFKPTNIAAPSGSHPKPTEFYITYPSSLTIFENIPPATKDISPAVVTTSGGYTTSTYIRSSGAMNQARVRDFIKGIDFRFTGSSMDSYPPSGSAITISTDLSDWPIVLDIPQPVVVKYQLDWNKGEATTATSGLPTPHYYFGNHGDSISESNLLKTDNSPNTTASLQNNFELDTVNKPAPPSLIDENRQEITYTYVGKPVTVDYYPNGGNFPTGVTAPVSVQSRYMDLFPQPTSVPTHDFSDLTGWTVSTNNSPDNFTESANLIDYSATRITTADISVPVNVYAAWTRNSWGLYFNNNGGTGSTGFIKVPVTPGTNEAQMDLTPYLPGGSDEPTSFGNGFLGWENIGNITNHGTGSTPEHFVMTGDVHLTAQWTDLDKLVADKMLDNIVYKDDRTVDEILKSLRPTYTDLLGNTHVVDLQMDSYDAAIIKNGGITNLHVTLNDPGTGTPIPLTKEYMDLYALNAPYMYGLSTYYMFTGEAMPSAEDFNVYLYTEAPDFANRTIIRSRTQVLTATDNINSGQSGIYGKNFYAVFTNFFGKYINVNWPAQVIVRDPQKLTKEEQVQVNSSEFWTTATSIYHKMSPGQIIEINEYNYKTGGSLLTEKVPANASYDRQIRVTPGAYVYMNPCILDRIKADKAGSMIVSMPGRSLSFNSKDFATDPTVSNVKYDPRGYFDLRMDLGNDEKVTALLPANTASMQFTLQMNCAWLAEPVFTVQVNDALKAAAANGNGLYLFNYNANTNELELIGLMSSAGNGNYQIPMSGAYGKYVITAGLPASGSYRLTENTNALTKQTTAEIVSNQKDSGKVTEEGKELNGISTNAKFFTEDLPISVEPAVLDTTPAKDNLLVRVITALAIGAVIASGCTVIYLRRKD